MDDVIAFRVRVTRADWEAHPSPPEAALRALVRAAARHGLHWPRFEFDFTADRVYFRTYHDLRYYVQLPGTCLERRGAYTFTARAYRYLPDLDEIPPPRAVRVRAGDIADGRRVAEDACPVTLAVARAARVDPERVHVDLYWITIQDQAGHIWRAPVSPALCRAIRCYDQEGIMRPRRIQLTWRKDEDRA